MSQSKAESELCDWLTKHRVVKPWLAAASLVAHGISSDELRPLTAMLNEAQFSAAVSWIAQFIELRGVILEAMRGTARISEIVNTMKSYSYMDQGPLQEIDIHNGIEDTLMVMTQELKNGIIVTRDYDRSLPRLQAYGSELNQVWTQIIGNAVEAMNGQGKLTIRTLRELDRAAVEIIDSGPGIAEEAMPHLFEPFYSSKPVGPTAGRGLGLHIAYRIVVHRHAGSIKAISHPGETIFRVTLPLSRPNRA
jgi:signal transduction histidine kinase